MPDIQLPEHDPRDNGCLCQRCERRYCVDFLLPDALWRTIHDTYNRLCGHCIVELLEQRGEFDYFDLTKLDAQPRKKSKKVQIEEELKRSDLTAQLAEREDISYCPSDSLPGGEHILRFGAAKKTT